MLVLSRKLNEKIIIANDIVVEIVDIRGDKIRLGITAPKEIPVHREEVHALLMNEQNQVTPQPEASL